MKNLHQQFFVMPSAFSWHKNAKRKCYRLKSAIFLKGRKKKL